MLIIEGADLVGKTTFCKLLLQDSRLADLGYMYHHLTRPPLKGFDGCKSYMDMAWRNYVQDRYHLSEPIYADVRGDDATHTSPEKYRLVDAHLRFIGALTVVITADDDLIRSRFPENESREMYNLDKILSANSRYESVGNHGCITLASKIYTPDIDFVVTCTKSDPFPTIDTAKAVIDSYLDRQAQVEDILG